MIAYVGAPPMMMNQEDTGDNDGDRIGGSGGAVQPGRPTPLKHACRCNQYSFSTNRLLHTQLLRAAIVLCVARCAPRVVIAFFWPSLLIIIDGTNTHANHRSRKIRNVIIMLEGFISNDIRIVLNTRVISTNIRSVIATATAFISRSIETTSSCSKFGRLSLKVASSVSQRHPSNSLQSAHLQALRILITRCLVRTAVKK